jgi:DNA-binding transcriptional ArsR family regulator
VSASTQAPAIERVLSALADPTRRRLLNRLSMHGEGTATVLAAEMSVSRQAIVQHLALLDSVGLVHSRRAGRERRYVVCPQRLTEAARWLDDLAAEWDSRLAAIKRIAERAATAELPPYGPERQEPGAASHRRPTGGTMVDHERRRAAE